MINFLAKLFVFIIVIIIVWIWYMNYCHPECPELWIDEVLARCKTGDLILFKAQDNFNSSKIFSYYTHVGVVYKHSKSNMIRIFEAQSPVNLELQPHENTKGIYDSEIHTRLTRYKGRLYYKPLNKPVSEELNSDFQNFIEYAQANMYYDNSVIWNGIKKKIWGERLHEGTNCGELTLLSLIKLGIIDPEKYYWRCAHHLYWVTNIEACDNGYCYLPISKIKISPFC